jgi:hypothetical protein
MYRQERQADQAPDKPRRVQSQVVVVPHRYATGAQEPALCLQGADPPLLGHLPHPQVGSLVLALAPLLE